MCLAVPWQLVEISAVERTGVVTLGNTMRTVNLDLVPTAKPGDFLLLHAGAAIEVLVKEEAGEVLRLYHRYAETVGKFTPEADNSNA